MDTKIVQSFVDHKDTTESVFGLAGKDLFVLSRKEGRDVVWGESGEWETIETKQIGSSRWSIQHTGIFKYKRCEKNNLLRMKILILRKSSELRWKLIEGGS